MSNINEIDCFNIAKMAQGALIEQFDAEFEKVLDNIADPNTPAEKARKIQIVLSLKPSSSRRTANIEFQTKSTLVPADKLKTEIAIGRDSDGRLVAEEFTGGIPGQMKINLDEEKDSEKVTNINKVR
ncbi:hypothetical protein SH1V18_15210 [Vallitalea longa]|uniref:Replication terminator protein n=1 Tax=Vallitalea longa TaxID=2936439 RepID=A0A9W6DDL1_9FIRM|nr:hypothetical protein [Vallitalea longa]GKX29041.1 hypothetical protein SH1V18_15210 [Vallitalea longa]